LLWLLTASKIKANSSEKYKLLIARNAGSMHCLFARRYSFFYCNVIYCAVFLPYFCAPSGMALIKYVTMKQLKLALALSVFVNLFNIQGIIAQETQEATTATPAPDFFRDRKFYLNNDGSNYIKFTFMTQAWARLAQYNPGSTINGYAKNSGTDFGIRRYRIQMYGQLTDRVFAYSQFGENNFNGLSDRKAGFFVHDALGEYAVDKRSLSLGMGISGWNGLARFASSSVGSIMGLDLPLYQEATNDVTDQFGRKLSIYAKGKIGRIDYRVSMAQPLAVQKMAGYTNAIGINASFSGRPAKMQYNTYVMYQFLDEESNHTPYANGSYLGKKRVFNIGAGMMYQKDAMWKQASVAADTIYEDMVHFSGDVYYDAPIGANGQSISLYGAYTHYDFGYKYLRNTAPLNPVNGSAGGTISGGGIGFPAYGTGNVLYVQAGYKFKDNLIGKTTLMPYASLQHAKYKRLNDGMNYIDAGVNWLLAGNVSKLTLAYQNRPVFSADGNKIDNKSAVVLQYQVLFN
jgi:hypothetical protein